MGDQDGPSLPSEEVEQVKREKKRSKRYKVSLKIFSSRLLVALYTVTSQGLTASIPVNMQIDRIFLQEYVEVLVYCMKHQNVL